MVKLKTLTRFFLLLHRITRSVFGPLLTLNFSMTLQINYYVLWFAAHERQLPLDGIILELVLED